ncbi:MAG TPA: glutathione transferase GstA [Myxococcaceae bacterium]|nr:glutathione transferase GstA [Myxococcaceae bacterium]
MKLWYATGTCSLAPHIALREAELPFDLIRFDMTRRILDDGGRLEAVNEKGYVPVLELPGGERLTEVPVVLQYIGDQRPERNLVPKAGTMERYRLQEWLSFIATEIHKIYWPLFHQGAEIENQKAKEKLDQRFSWLETKLHDGSFLMGNHFTVADAYLFTVLNWAKPAGIDLNRWPKLKAYRSRIRERPSVVAAFEAEGMGSKKA